MTKVTMVMFDENMNNVSNEYVELGGDIVSKVNGILSKQNMVKRKILILLFAILAITSDMIAIYLIKSGYNVPF